MYVLHTQELPIWKQSKVWKGFIICCHRTLPQSFDVLLNIPGDQLKSAFDNICPELETPFLNQLRHMHLSTDVKRISQSIMLAFGQQLAKTNGRG